MTTSYPTGIDVLLNPTATTPRNSVTVPHSAQHANANDAIEAVETKLGTGASTPVVGRALVGTATGASAWQAKITVDLRDFAATGGGLIDETTGIQAAITQAETYPGAVVMGQPVPYLITTGLTVGRSGVRIILPGHDTRHSAAPPTGTNYSNTNAAGALVWGGAAGGTMLTFAPSSGTTALGGVGFEGTLIGSVYPHLANVADYGLVVKSAKHSRFDVMVQEFGAAGVLISGKSGMSAGEGSVVYSRFRITGRQTTAAGSILRMTGIDSVGDGYNNEIDVEGLYLGHGMDLWHCDSNSFPFVRLQRAAGGTGRGVYLHASSYTDGVSRGHRFGVVYPGAGGFYSEGTEGNTYATYANEIECYDRDEDSAPASPTVGAGAVLHWKPRRAAQGPGRAPYVLPLGLSQGLATDSTLTLAAAGGALASPLTLDAYGRLDRVCLVNSDASLTRTAEWGLYQDQGDTASSLFTRIKDGSYALAGTFSFTGSGEAAVFSTPTGVPLEFGPGLYWLVIRNTHASNTFAIATKLTGTLDRSMCRTTTGLAALGATIDFSGWSGNTRAPFLRLDCRIGGESTAFG